MATKKKRTKKLKTVYEVQYRGIVSGNWYWADESTSLREARELLKEERERGHANEWRIIRVTHEEVE